MFFIERFSWNYLILQQVEPILSLGCSNKATIFFGSEQLFRYILLKWRQISHARMPFIDWTAFAKLMLQRRKLILLNRFQRSAFSNAQELLKYFKFNRRHISDPRMSFVKWRAFDNKIPQIVENFVILRFLRLFFKIEQFIFLILCQIGETGVCWINWLAVRNQILVFSKQIILDRYQRLGTLLLFIKLFKMFSLVWRQVYAAWMVRVKRYAVNNKIF